MKLEKNVDKGKHKKSLWRMPVISCAASKLPWDQVKVPVHQEKERSGHTCFHIIYYHITSLSPPCSFDGIKGTRTHTHTHTHTHTRTHHTRTLPRNAHTTRARFPTVYLFAFSLETKLPRKVPWRPFKISGFIATSSNNIVTAQNKRDSHALISILFHISWNTGNTTIQKENWLH